MDKHDKIWRNYYRKSVSKPHSYKTEQALMLCESDLKIATDCGCGTGSDTDFLQNHGYQVNAFDINPDSVEICRSRFADNSLVDVRQSSFESYRYPAAGLIIAHSSLFFADPSRFSKTWLSINASLVKGGVFSGDFMGLRDSWASNYRTCTNPLSEQAVRDLFVDFELLEFKERDEQGMTAIGKSKHWHTCSVIAIKRH